MDQLPIEIIAHVLDFVDPPDVERASWVCRSWFEASLHPRLVKTLFIGRKTRCNSATVSQSTFTQDNATLRLTIQGREKGDDLSWNNANANYPPGNEVKSLVITTDKWVSPYLYVVILNDILGQFPEIEDLELRHINMHVGFRGDVSLSTHLQSLVMLKLAFIENLPNFIFGPTMGYLPQIKSLTLESEVHFNNPDEKEVYTSKKKSVLRIEEFKRICDEYWEILDEIDVTYSLLSEDNMQELCNRLHPNIQTIKLSRCAYIDDAALNILSCTVRPRVLEIDSFLYSSKAKVTGNGVAAIGIRMRCVQYLSLYINDYIRLNDDLFVSGFLGLNSFNMTSYGERSNYCLVKLSKKKLCIENLCKIDGTDLLVSLSRGSPDLQELSLDLICQITNRDIFIIAEKFPNIRVLKLNSCCELTDKCFIGVDANIPKQSERPSHRERHGTRSRGRTSGIAANFDQPAADRTFQGNHHGPTDSVTDQTSGSNNDNSAVTVNGGVNAIHDDASHGEVNGTSGRRAKGRSGHNEHFHSSSAQAVLELRNTPDDRVTHSLGLDVGHPRTESLGVDNSNGLVHNESLEHSMSTRVCDRSDGVDPSMDQVTQSLDNHNIDLVVHSSGSWHDQATHSLANHISHGYDNKCSVGLSDIRENHNQDVSRINISDRSASVGLSTREVGQWLQRKLIADTTRKNRSGYSADNPDCAGIGAGVRSNQCVSWNGQEGHFSIQDDGTDRCGSAPALNDRMTSSLVDLESNYHHVNGTRPGCIEADCSSAHPPQRATNPSRNSHDRYRVNNLESSHNKKHTESYTSHGSPNNLDEVKRDDSSSYKFSEIVSITQEQEITMGHDSATGVPSITSAGLSNGRATTDDETDLVVGVRSSSLTSTHLDSCKSDSGERNLSSRSLPVESVSHSAFDLACKSVDAPLPSYADSRRMEESSHRCLRDLKQLETLCLVGCCEVSDVALSRAIVFPLLTHLKLTHCDNLTDGGVEAVTTNNPKLDTFILEFCRQITDTSVESVIKNLKQSLRRAKFENCGKLTGASLIHVATFHGESLREVYIGGCPIKRPEIEEFKKTTPAVKFEDFDW